MRQVLINASRSGLLLLLAIAGLVVARYWGSYLMFHVLVEFFSAVVLSNVFVVTWNTRQRQTNGYLTLAGLASLFMAAIVMVHTLAYDGMDIIPGVTGANPATQLWIAMGIMKSLTLVIAPLFVNRHVNPGVVVSIYTLAFCLVIVTIFEYPIFPDCYIDGQGLTPFKVYAEYVISALLVLGALGWWFIRDRFSPNIRYLLVGALATTVASELIFTLYGLVDGPWNMYGHILNMVAYYMLYKAVAQAAIADPFGLLLRDLKLREEELEQRVVELDVARKDAEQASRAKGHFLAVLSHELRTPLTPVLAAVSDMLQDQRTPQHQLETLRMIQRNVELQARLIDDLLDLTRIDRGKMRVERTALDVHNCVRYAAETCRAEYEKKGVELHLALEAADSWVSGDSARLEQVVWNLLTNGRKFTPAGGRVTVRTSNERSVDLKQMLVLEVSDTGIGIDPAVQGRLFTPFEQVGEAAARGEGLGLGLAITRAMVTLHGGTITLRSEGIGKGTTFTIKLPTVRKPANATSYSTDSTAHRTISRRILLVEDHSDTARVIARLLQRDGHHVEVARDLASARKYFSSNNYDLVISDIGLPDGSGIDLLKEFKADRPTLPAICMSGYGSESDLSATAEAGIFCHLVKPVTVQRLRQAIIEASSSGSSGR